MGRSQITDSDIGYPIPIEVGHAVLLAIGSIGDAVLGMATTVSVMVDFAPFHIGTKQPFKCE